MANGDAKGGVARISVEGSPLPTSYETAIYSVKVDQRLNAPTKCVIALNPVDIEDDSLRGLNFEVFDLGSELKVEMGFQQTEPVFSGKVTAVEPTYAEVCRRVNVTGYDSSYKLQFGTKAKVFEEMTYSAIVSEVLEEAGLLAEVEETEAVHPYTAQINVSDYRLLTALAERIGYELITSGRTVTFRKARLDGVPVAELEYGAGLDEFEVRARVLTHGSTVSRLGWDPRTKEVIDAEVTSAPPDTRMGGEETGFELSEEVDNSPITGTSASIVDIEGARELATGARTDLMNGFITGTGTCAGNGKINAGTTVKLAGVGDRFNGLYYVVGATHSLTQSNGYRTLMELRRTGI